MEVPQPQNQIQDLPTRGAKDMLSPVSKLLLTRKQDALEQQQQIEAALAREDMMSPVSKMQLKLKQDDLEQRKRIDAVLAREKDQIKRKIRKRKQLEARLEDHLKRKIRKQIPDPKHRAQEPVDDDSEEEEQERQQQQQQEPEVAMPIKVEVTKTTAANKIAMNLTSAFDEADSQDMEVDEPEQTSWIKPAASEGIPRRDLDLEDLTKLDQVSNLEMVEGDEITRTLLQTRARLKVLAANGVVQEIVPDATPSPSSANRMIHPTTNYHLKRLGLADKVDIYAPLHEQERNVRTVMREWQDEDDHCEHHVRHDHHRQQQQEDDKAHTCVSASRVTQDHPAALDAPMYRERVVDNEEEAEEEGDSEYVPEEHHDEEDEDEESESLSLAETESESEVSRLLREKDMPLDELVHATTTGTDIDDDALPTPSVILGFCVLLLALLWFLDMDKLLQFLENAAKATRNTVTGDQGGQ